MKVTFKKDVHVDSSIHRDLEEIIEEIRTGNSEITLPTGSVRPIREYIQQIRDLENEDHQKIAKEYLPAFMVGVRLEEGPKQGRVVGDAPGWNLPDGDALRQEDRGAFSGVGRDVLAHAGLWCISAEVGDRSREAFHFGGGTNCSIGEVSDLFGGPVGEGVSRGCAHGSCL